MTNPSNKVENLLVVLAATLGVVLGCGVVDPSETGRLNDAWQRWAQSGITSYEIDFQRHSCECLPESTRPVRITVVDGKVVQAVDRLSGADLQDHLASFLSVDGLFALMATVLEQNPFRFDAAYDPGFGFPTSVSLDIDQQTADDEVAYTMGNLSPR